MTRDELSDYDAGYLNDYGGGNVAWWQDYVRAEIGRANDFWRSQIETIPGLSGLLDGTHVAVPREPTEAMLDAACPFPAHLVKAHPDPADPWHQWMRAATKVDQLAAASTYRTLIAASPYAKEKP